MKKKVLYGAAFGLFFASIASMVARYRGFNPETFTVFLYLYVALGALYPVKKAISSGELLPDMMHRLVIVAEGEELRMKKLFTGEKYKVKGEIEKL